MCSYGYRALLPSAGQTENYISCSQRFVLWPSNKSCTRKLFTMWMSSLSVRPLLFSPQRAGPMLAPPFLSVSPCEAVMADFSGLFVGHTGRQRLGGDHQLTSANPGRGAKSVPLPRTDKTLHRLCHWCLFLLHHPREPVMFTSALGAASLRHNGNEKLRTKLKLDKQFFLFLLVLIVLSNYLFWNIRFNIINQFY